jgi:hypothetical protein
VKIIFKRYGRKKLIINTKTYASKWINLTINHTPSKYEQIITPEIVEKYLEYLFANLYITHGDQIFRQLTGIPQGASPCVYLANFYLFTYEYEWLLRVLKHKNQKLIDMIPRVFRLIDDILLVDHDYNFPCVEESIWGLYPKYLGLQLEQDSNAPGDDKKPFFRRAVTFLNLTINTTFDKNKNTNNEKVKNFVFATRPFDKTLDPNYGTQLMPLVRKYPRPDSCLSSSTHRNTLTQLLISNTRLSSKYKHVPFSLAKIMARYLQNGTDINFLFDKLNLAYVACSDQFKKWGKAAKEVRAHVLKALRVECQSHKIYKTCSKNITEYSAKRKRTHIPEVVTHSDIMKWGAAVALNSLPPSKRRKTDKFTPINFNKWGVQFVRASGRLREDRDLMQEWYLQKSVRSASPSSFPAPIGSSCAENPPIDPELLHSSSLTLRCSVSRTCSNYPDSRGPRMNTDLMSVRTLCAACARVYL